MKTTLAALLLLATTAFAQTPPREPFPSEYVASPCAADADAVCESFPQAQMRAFAKTFRGYSLEQQWADAHWDEMRALFAPFCKKIGNCFTNLNNDWVYCLDLARDDFLGTCSRFPEGSHDRDQCTMFAMTYYVGLGPKTKLHAAAQECAKQTPAPAALRKLEGWIQTTPLRIDHDGELLIQAIDAETRVPVRAKVTINGDGELRSTEGPVPTTGYPLKWKAKMVQVPDGKGHRKIVAPTVTFTADGYEPLTVQMPIPIPTMAVEMTPAAAKLRRGKNEITITARDTVTGKPVWGRVYAGETVLGETNKPLTLELQRGQKRPEIWVMSLYDRYDDVVVAPAEQ